MALALCRSLSLNNYFSQPVFQSRMRNWSSTRYRLVIRRTSGIEQEWKKLGVNKIVKISENSPILSIVY